MNLLFEAREHGVKSLVNQFGNNGVEVILDTGPILTHPTSFYLSFLAPLSLSTASGSSLFFLPFAD